MTVLSRGANAPLGGAAPYTVVVTHGAGAEVDLIGFLLSASGRAVNEDGMSFYNQPEVGGYPGVRWQAGGDGRHELVLDPARWPADLARVRVGLTLGTGTFGAVRGLAARVLDASGAEVAQLDLGRPDTQNALIVGEVYRHASGLKVRCVGDGFTDGLRGLATDAGIATEEESPATVPPPPAFAPPPPPANLTRAKAISLTKPPPSAPKIDLRKYEVSVALVNNQLDGHTFRVVLAIDCSGSTKHLFANGTMHRSLERMVAIADILDDDGQMEVWFFGDYAVRSAPVTVGTMTTYLDDNRADKKKAEGGNYEPRVMKEIVDWTRAEPSPQPTLVLFWSDGGVHAEKKIFNLLVESSGLPVYWMFLGLGRADYGVLARLDNVRGGVVDNAGFLPIDDIDLMSDTDLYSQIFGWFVRPWITAAAQAGIIG